MIRNKKGSHVGMILSFLVFITFTAFLYTVIEPATRTNEDKSKLMEYLKVELLNEFSEDISTLTIKVPPATRRCIAFKIPDDDLNGKKVIAKDLDGNLYTTFAGPRRTRIEFTEGGVLKVFYSDEFETVGSVSFCDFLVEGTKYNISLFKTDQEIFESKIINISEKINTNKSKYEELKEKFDVGVGNEFGFTFSDGEKNVIAKTEEVNISTDIFVEEIPIQYIDNEANIKSGFLSIKVW